MAVFTHSDFVHLQLPHVLLEAVGQQSELQNYAHHKTQHHAQQVVIIQKLEKEAHQHQQGRQDKGVEYPPQYVGVVVEGLLCLSG